MLEVYYGTDTIAVRQKVNDRAHVIRDEGGVVTAIDSNSYTAGILTDLAKATSLFGETGVYILDTPSESKEFSDAVFEELAALADSPHIFIVSELALLTAAKKQYQKYAAVCEEFKATKAASFNTFALADALAQKNKKQLWLLLHEAYAVHQSAEEIIGVLWWQLKALRLAALTTSAAEADMKDYPYNKAKRSLSHFKPDELEQLSDSLLDLYHAGHAGRTDINVALEKWVLTM